MSEAVVDQSAQGLARLSQPDSPLAPEAPQTFWRQKNLYYHQDLEKLHQFLIPSQKRVLQIGVGTGDLLDGLQPAYGVGIDPDPAVIEQAQQHFPRLNWQVQKLEALTWDPRWGAESDCFDPFDYIIFPNTLSRVSDIQQVFERVRPLCSAATRLIISSHNPLWEPLLQMASWLKQRMPLPALNWLSQQDIANLLDLAGFETIRQGKRLLMPKSIPLLASLINRGLAPLPGFNHLCLTEYMVSRPQIPPSTFPTRHQPLQGITPVVDLKVDPINPAESLSCSVIIPARNEAGNILNCVQNLPLMGSHTEIIFVEGHSTDHTWLEIQKIQAEWATQRDIKIMQQDGKGKADAVRKGFAAATGDILMILDADLTVQAEDMPKFFRAVATGRCDFANGCRLIYPLNRSSMPDANRWGNRFFAALLSYILNIRIKDSLCGTKVLRRSDYLEILANQHYFGDFDPFGDFDLLLGATKNNLKIVDIPVRYYPRVYGRSNIQHVRDGLKLLKICWFAAQKFKFS
ncbi:MAG: glycosyltransferase [Cyanobacteriota bacterium]|nr:glycosyltransferase [Cyanobacteriota bacterium]